MENNVNKALRNPAFGHAYRASGLKAIPQLQKNIDACIEKGHDSSQKADHVQSWPKGEKR